MHMLKIARARSRCPPTFLVIQQVPPRLFLRHDQYKKTNKIKMGEKKRTKTKGIDNDANPDVPS